jgi:2-polyprenyl-3-methyl-5-hydroxy-6-metoxy-1,4-benzoquinol methylase
MRNTGDEMGFTEHNEEKQRQQTYTWARAQSYADYNAFLGHYQVVACLEHVRGDSLLDLACGDGLVTEKLASRFERVVGVDANSARIAEARKRLPHIKFFDSLIEDIDFDERFDNITMLNLLEHVENPTALLRRAARWLTPTGRLHVHVPNAMAVNRVIAVIMGTLESCEELSPNDIHVAGHRRSYDMQSLVGEVKTAGLNVTASGGVFYKMLSTPQMDWLLKAEHWEQGGFGWGRMGAEKAKDWRTEFSRACYEYGKTRPEDCNVIYACCSL